MGRKKLSGLYTRSERLVQIWFKDGDQIKNLARLKMAIVEYRKRTGNNVSLSTLCNWIIGDTLSATSDGDLIAAMKKRFGYSAMQGKRWREEKALLQKEL